MGLLPALLGGPTSGSTTVADLIKGAFRVMGVLASGESPSAAEQQDGLTALNRMMDSWANQRLALFGTSRDSYTLTPNLNPHTIGVADTVNTPSFNATRPVRINRASIILAGQGNSELPLSLVSDAEWQITQGKATTGTPTFLWAQMSYPLVSLWLNPAPVAADTLVLYTWLQLGRFASTNTVFAMPPGYEEAIVYNLAKRLCPEFGVQLSAEAQETAVESLASLKRTNTQPSYLRSDSAVLRPGPFNIISGDRG